MNQSRYTNMDGQASSHSDEYLKELIRQSQHGDDEAFGKLYDTLAEPVYRFIFIKTQHKETAEDLLSITFLKVWQNIHTYRMRNNSKFTTWLFQIAHNVTRDFWRKQKAEVSIDDYAAQVVSKDSPDERLDFVLSYERIMEGLKGLSDRYQSVLTLRFINQLSVEETAQAMDMSSGAVRVLQTRALKAIRKNLE